MEWDEPDVFKTGWCRNNEVRTGIERKWPLESSHAGHKPLLTARYEMESGQAGKQGKSHCCFNEPIIAVITFRRNKVWSSE